MKGEQWAIAKEAYLPYVRLSAQTPWVQEGYLERKRENKTDSS